MAVAMSVTRLSYVCPTLISHCTDIIFCTRNFYYSATPSDSKTIVCSHVCLLAFGRPVYFCKYFTINNLQMHTQLCTVFIILCDVYLISVEFVISLKATKHLTCKVCMHACVRACTSARVCRHGEAFFSTILIHLLQLEHRLPITRLLSAFVLMCL